MKQTDLRLRESDCSNDEASEAPLSYFNEKRLPNPADPAETQ